MGRSRDLADGTLAELNVDSNTLAVDATNNRVGIGTASPTEKLDVVVDSTTSSRVHTDLGGTSSKYVSWNIDSGETYDDSRSILYFNHSGTVGATLQTSYRTGTGITDGLVIRTHEASPITLLTNNAERMRIDSSGNVLVNTTGTGSYLDGKIIAIASGTSPALTVKNLSTNQFVASFWNNGTTGNNIIQQFITETSPSVRGSITYNRGGGVIAFNTSSDYRLKENIVDLPNSLETISKLKPRQFDWKETGNTTTGFIAHELAEICPHAVNGDKDAVDSDGNPVYQGVDASKLVPLLTAALQEAITKIETLEARVATLESA